MGCAEYDNQMSNIMPVDTEEQQMAFQQLHEKANKLYIGKIEEVERFKSVMDKLMSIESDLKAIKKHFNIVPIIGENLTELSGGRE